jgi:hypothetical protein
MTTEVANALSMGSLKYGPVRLFAQEGTPRASYELFYRFHDCYEYPGRSRLWFPLECTLWRPFWPFPNQFATGGAAF